MKPAALLLFGALALPLAADETAFPGPAEAPAELLLPQPDEEVILPALKSLVFMADALASDTTAAEEGLDLSRVPWLQTPAFADEMAPFINRPVSLGSLDRLQSVVRLHLQFIGRPFARVYAPPQDITDGTVRVVVQLATLEGDVRLDGNKWFARERYAGVLRARSGEAFDAAAFNADLSWLNRNPFSRVTPVIEAGEEPGTTRVTLRAEERFPFTFSAGYDNTGTRNTDEDRVSASVQWGNALGRGDLMSYRLSGDPSFDHMRSHSLSYTTFLPWRHVLTLQTAHSEIDSTMPAPFTQGGTSWQVAGRYEMPLAPPRNGWTQSLSFGGDFKYSDNTLEFAAIPVTNNVTHIAQVGATYGVTFPAFGGRSSATISGYASPGGLTRYNGSRAFSGSRPGARADYVYGKLTLTHQRALPLGFSWSTVADFQVASGALLGSEQLSGAGTYAVRGYRENSAFGDDGVVVNNELHLPPVTWAAARTQIDAFVFLDAASLHLNVDDDNVELSSAGFGTNVGVNRWLSVRFAYGWQIKSFAGGTNGRDRGHIAANVSW